MGVSCFSFRIFAPVSCASIRTKCKAHLQKTNAVGFWGELDIYGWHFFIYPLLPEVFKTVPRDWSNEALRMKICQNSAFHEKFDIVTVLFTSPPLPTPLKKILQLRNKIISTPFERLSSHHSSGSLQLFFIVFIFRFIVLLLLFFLFFLWFFSRRLPVDCVKATRISSVSKVK